MLHAKDVVAERKKIAYGFFSWGLQEYATTVTFIVESYFGLSKIKIKSCLQFNYVYYHMHLF